MTPPAGRQPMTTARSADAAPCPAATAVAASATSALPSPAPAGDDYFALSGLRETLALYLDAREVAEIHKACRFGARAHTGQTRRSGEPYIHHPIEVARTMAELRLDKITIIAGLLHDVLEDTHVTRPRLRSEFGDAVTEVVEGVSKLQGLDFESVEVRQAENFQKMMLAVAKDLRVILVKIADRLHNMRTLRHMPPARQKAIARETLEIYAPLALRLGMGEVRLEFEDLAFKALHPLRCTVLEKRARERSGSRLQLMEKTVAGIRRHLRDSGVPCRVQGRRKHVYSIYRKMREKRLPFSQIMDIFAVRLIVDNVGDCYRALGLMHNFYKPVPGRFKDYIAIPKANGYQSLHTILFGPQGVLMETQIRTREMDEVAQTGVAAYALYKIADGRRPRKGSDGVVKTQEWLQGLFGFPHGGGDSLEFMEHLKAGLIPDDIYVFTPQGEIMALPRKATALDFAFAVHTDLGLSATGARIDKRLSTLSTVLQSGQTVEVVTAEKARPNPGWLSFAVTAKARAAIRHYLKNIRDDDAVRLGKHLLNEALRNYQTGLGEIDKGWFDKVAGMLDVAGRDALFREIGLGNHVPQLIAARLADSERVAERPIEIARSTALRGAKGLVVTCAKCCYPIPGDAVIGIMNPGKGLVVHRDGCPNAATLRRKKDNTIPLQWTGDSGADDEYSAAIRAVTRHQRGVLASIAAKVAEMGSNIENISIEERGTETAAITFVISVNGRPQLEKIMRKIVKAVEGTEVQRIGFPGGAGGAGAGR